MKAAIYRGNNKIVLEEVAIPEATSECILVDNKVTGICGSDLHNYYGDWSQPSHASGHELTGVVVEKGEGASRFNVGDRVFSECFSHCGRCRFCKTGLYNLCDNRVFMADRGHSGFSEYSILYESSLYSLPDKISFEEGALIEPVAVAYRAFHRSGADHRDTIAVLGGGAIGLLCLSIAKTLGVKEAFISVKYEHQAAVSEKFGADLVIRTAEQDVLEEIKSRTCGLGADVVIDTVGSSKTFRESLTITRKRGRICLVGGYTGTIDADLAPIVWKELHIMGSNCYGYSGTRRDFNVATDLVASGNIELKAIITHRFSLDDIVKAFETASDKKTGSIKVQIQQL